jgi:hypothetical protein
MDGYNSDATNKSSTTLGWNSSCFRCRGPHPWMCNKVVLCPHKDCVGIREAAMKNYKELLAKYKACHKKHMGIDYNCLSNANKVKIKKQVLSRMANSLVKDAPLLPSQRIQINNPTQSLQGLGTLIC